MRVGPCSVYCRKTRWLLTKAENQNSNSYQGHICFLMKLVQSIWNPSCIITIFGMSTRCTVPWYAIGAVTLIPQNRWLPLRRDKCEVKVCKRLWSRQDEMRRWRDQRSRRGGQASWPMERIRFITCARIINPVTLRITGSSHLLVCYRNALHRNKILPWLERWLNGH